MPTLRSLPFAAALAVACQAGGAARSIRPEEPRAAAALKDGDCLAGQSVSPLMVDFPVAERHELEAAMALGVAVVSYDCQRFRVLSSCDLEGSYGYVGLSRREEVVRLRDADELKINLPLAGAGLVSNLDVDTARGSTLDVGVVLVGKRRTVRSSVEPSELRGDCAGATHFVRGASIGAFAVSKGSSAQIRSAVEVFHAAASGASSSSAATQTRDGDLSACTSASDAAPPNGCMAPVRVELITLSPERDDSGAKGSSIAEPALESHCPERYVFAEGRCVAAAAASATRHVCDYGDEADCEAQCSAGEPESCWNLGHMLASGSGLEKDEVRSRQVLAKACSAGSAGGCKSYGWMLANAHGGVADPNGAAKAYRSSCDGGHGEGCMNLGVLVEKADRPRAASLYKRGCSAGSVESCVAYGAALEAGFNGVPNDSEAARLYREACDAGSPRGCAGIGNALLFGKGVAVDRPRGIELLRRGCKGGNAWGCSVLQRAGEKR
jgi:uncharacterized protein